jgi:hypothetical protein
MISRTYPSECTIYNCDDLIISAIRDRLGDRIELKRIHIPNTGDFSEYVDSDNSTFYISDPKVWPYHIKVGTTTCSGLDNPQIINYHYLSFPDYNLTASGVDFWVETFRLSDYEIWLSYLSVDLSPLVTNPDCITPEMEILKAAIDLIPSIRGKKFDDGEYSSKEIADKNTSYRQSLSGGVDPYRDLLNTLQRELDLLLEKNCLRKLYRGGYRIE